MAKKKDRLAFELVALEAELREHPGDDVRRKAFLDCLQEQGSTPIGAKRITTRVIREGTEQRQKERVEAMLSGNADEIIRVQDAIGSATTAIFGGNVNIEIIKGGATPFVASSYGRGGNTLMNTAQRDAELKGIATAIGLTVESCTIRVGAAWVLRRMEERKGIKDELAAIVERWDRRKRSRQ